MAALTQPTRPLLVAQEARTLMAVSPLDQLVRRVGPPVAPVVLVVRALVLVVLAAAVVAVR